MYGGIKNGLVERNPKKAGIEEGKHGYRHRQGCQHFIPKDKYNEVAEAKKKLEDDSGKDQQEIKNAAAKMRN